MADEKKLAELHTLLAEEFYNQITEGTVREERNEIVRLSPGASLLNAARQFLKDNNIDVNASRLREDSPMMKLANKLEEDEYFDENLPEFKQ